MTPSKRNSTRRISRQGEGGYTLVELLVVVVLTVILLLTTVSLFFTTLLGGGKTANYEYVKQTGDHAITQIAYFLRNARKLLPNYDFQTCETAMDSISMQNQDYQTVIFSLADGHIASTAAAMTPNDIAVSGFSFSCSRIGQSLSPQVTIQFVLTKTGVGSQARDAVQIPFQTTVTMRNAQ